MLVVLFVHAGVLIESLWLSLNYVQNLIKSLQAFKSYLCQSYQFTWPQNSVCILLESEKSLKMLSESQWKSCNLRRFSDYELCNQRMFVVIRRYLIPRVFARTLMIIFLFFSSLHFVFVLNILLFYFKLFRNCSSWRRVSETCCKRCPSFTV